MLYMTRTHGFYSIYTNIQCSADASLFDLTLAYRRSFWLFDGACTVKIFSSENHVLSSFCFVRRFFQSFAGNKSFANVSVREQLHLAALKCFQTEIFLGYMTNRRLWNTSLTFDFSRTLACARMTFLVADEVADNLCIWCRSCRSRSAATFHLSVFPVLSMRLIKSNNVLFFHFSDGNSLIIVNALQPFSSLNAFIKILLSSVKGAMFANKLRHKWRSRFCQEYLIHH